MDGASNGAGGPGRLELTWANKNQRLLAHGADTYEWVDPHDWRVAEVRLLTPQATYGDPEAGNLLVAGDALHALTALTSLPELAGAYVGKVKLCYIDPPFNTGQTFSAYDDAVEHSVWLTMLRDRLTQIKQLLSPDGSVWVHVDDYEQHRARCVLDEVFGADRFVATIVWQKRYSRDNRPAIGSVHDYIHVYAPNGPRWKEHRNRIARTEAKQYRNPNNDPRGRWRPIPLDVQAGHASPSQFYEVTTPAGVVHSPANGRAWSVSKPRMDELIAAGLVYFGKDDRGKPNLIRYLDEDKGLVPWSWWPHEEVGHNDEAKKEVIDLFPGVEAFPTPKPERLLARIISVATNPGDLVLDCYAGAATTAAVATKMGRRWVTVEINPDTVADYINPRLQAVVDGRDPGGVSEEFGWTGGSGFTSAVVHESMFETLDDVVVLADWAVGGGLAGAVAAQFGYQLDPDPPFIARKGRSRLAVLDGMLTTAVADHLLTRLDDQQQLLVVAQSLEPGVEDYVRQSRPGSRARKVPRDLARAGILPSRLVRLAAKQADEQGDEGGEA